MQFEEGKKSCISTLTLCTLPKFPKQIPKVDLRMKYFDVDKVLGIEDAFNYRRKM